MLHANGGSCSDPVSVSTSQMGSAFEEMLETLRATLEGATFLTLDIWNVTTIGASNPAPLGKSGYLVRRSFESLRGGVSVLHSSC
jgi:hypothetical protein